MKDRIVRIEMNQYGNPRIVWHWALMVGLLMSFLLVGTASAQRRASRVEQEQPEPWEVQRGAIVDQRDNAPERRERLAAAMEEVEKELGGAVERLHALEEAGKGDSEEAAEMRERTGNLERHMAQLRRGRQAVEQQRSEPSPAEQREAQKRELVTQQRELQEQGRLLEAQLRELKGEESEVGVKMRKRLDGIHQQLERIQRARRDLEQAQPSPRPQTRTDNLRRRNAELENKADGVRRALEALGDRYPELSARLERELHELQMQMEAIRRIARREGSEPARNELEVKVQQLNGRVEDLSREMREIRGLLERLIEQGEVKVIEREVEVRRGRGRQGNTEDVKKED